MQRTLRWLERCMKAKTQRPSGAVRHRAGGVLARTAHGVRHGRWPALDLPGLGIGGLSVGEPKEIMYDILEAIDAPSSRRTSPAT